MTTPPPNGPPESHPGYDPTQQYRRPGPRQGPSVGPSPYGPAPCGQPQYGQPQYGQAPYGHPPRGPAPNAGPYYAAPPGPPPQKPKSSAPIIITGIVLVVLIAVGAGALITISRSDGDDAAAPSSSRSTADTPVTSSRPGGDTVRSTEVGSCITVTGTTSDVDTEGISCDDASPPSYIVGAKLPSKDACESAGYYSYVYEYGIGASSDYLCLIPNWQVGTCYEQSSFDVELKTVACSLSSTPTTTRLRVTERADSARVPNCTGSDKLKVFAFDVRSSPASRIAFCAEILGDYVWE